MSKEKNGFILYKNFENQFSLLSLEERGRLITVIFEYARSGEISLELSLIEQMAFSIIKECLDRDREEYAAKCEQNAKNGKRGGRPKSETTQVDPIFLSKTERFSEKPKKADKDMDMDKEMDKDMDMDMDMDMGTELDMDSRSAPYSSAPSHSVVAPREKEAENKSICDIDCSQSVGKADIKRSELSDEDRTSLLSKGVDPRYIDERLERAGAYASENSKTVYSVLLEWWAKDKSRYTSCHSPPRISGHSHDERDCSFDVDSFFEAAQRRTFEEL